MSTVRKLKNLDSTWMSIPNLTKHLLETRKVTGHGQPITLIFTHYRVNMGFLPYDMGGNVIEVAEFQGVKYAKISDKIRPKKAAGRKKGKKATRRPPNRSLVYKINNGETIT